MNKPVKLRNILDKQFLPKTSDFGFNAFIFVALSSPVAARAAEEGNQK